MIQRPKKQSFDASPFRTAAFCAALVIFFIYALHFNSSFFAVLAFGSLFCIGYFVPLRARLAGQEAAVSLQIQDVQEKINLEETEILREQKAVEALRAKIADYSKLKDLTERLSSSLTLEDTSAALSREVNALFGERDTMIILYLFHSKTGELGISSSQRGQMHVNIRSKKGDLFDQWVIKTLQPLLVEDVKSDYRFDLDKTARDETRPIRSLMIVPLMVGHKTLGLLRVDNPHQNQFHMEDLRFLTTIGDLGAIAIENAELYEHVKQLAIKDGLTGLYLKRYLLERLPEEISRELRRGSELSFLMIDLDHFKKYNDRFGHVAGDIVLRTIGLMLGDFFPRPGDLLCRYGGEEFSILLPDCPRTKAVQLAEQFRRKIEQQPFLLRREMTHITVSIGVASFPADAQLKDELIQKADQALYRAKQEGRNRVYAA